MITRCFLARLRSKRSVRTSVYAGFAVLLLTFASSSLVIALLAAIRTLLAITTGDAAMTTIAYFAGCAASLLFFGRLSNRFGRRPMAALAALLVLAVLMLLSQLESLAALYIARLLQGFASGLTASAVIAWIVESIPAVYAKSSAVSAAIVGGGPSIGFAVGALLTGIWIESLKMPLQWLILSLGTAAVLTLPAIFLSAETAHCRPIPLKDLLICAGRHRSAGDRSYGKNGSAHLGTDGGDLYEIQTEKTIRPIIEKRRV